MIILYPYKLGSNSAKKLQVLLQAEGLKCKRVRGYGHYKPKVGHIILNWGNSTNPNWLYDGMLKGELLNHPANVEVAINKLNTFQHLKETDVPIPEFTTEKEEAVAWLTAGCTILCRRSVTSFGGKHITIAKDLHELVDAPLYVKYKKKRKEFRVHVFNGKVIDVLEKRKVNGFYDLPNANQLIRSHANGWVFCRDSLVTPPTLNQIAIYAVKALGLDFGGVDIIWNELEDKCYVLEVNSAPGLEGTSLVKYKEAILAL